MTYKPSPMKKALARFEFTQKERTAFYNQIIALRETGMPMVQVLEMCWDVASEEGRKPGEGQAIITADMIRKMKNGDSLAEAISEWVPAEDVMIFEAIQDSRHFSKNLRDYMEISEKKRKIRWIIIAGLAMPSFLTFLTIAMSYYFGAKVVPTISETMPMEQWRGGALILKYMAYFAQHLVLWVLLGVVAFGLFISFLLPRWAGKGREIADRLPIFSTYRVYTGISFLVALSSLTTSGVNMSDALTKLKARSNPYVRYRIALIYLRYMDGENLGEALHRTGTGWPDPKMNLSIKIFAETQDLATQLSRLARHWIDESQATVARNMGLVSTAGLFLVFAVLFGFIGGTFALNSQVTAAAGAM